MVIGQPRLMHHSMPGEMQVLHLVDVLLRDLVAGRDVCARQARRRRGSRGASSRGRKPRAGACRHHPVSFKAGGLRAASTWSYTASGAGVNGTRAAEAAETSHRRSAPSGSRLPLAGAPRRRASPAGAASAGGCARTPSSALVGGPTTVATTSAADAWGSALCRDHGGRRQRLEDQVLVVADVPSDEDDLRARRRAGRRPPSR